MPLPFIPLVGAGIALVTGAYGVKKGFDAKSDMDLAKSINKDAQTIASETEAKVTKGKDSSKKAIEGLGKKKVELLSTSINDFVNSFEKIKNIDFKESEGLSELKNFDPKSESFQRLKEVSYEARQVAVNGLSAIGGGALLAFGTYNVVMGGLGGLLVTATTGTALSSLTGVAATNATLAWLGGGALSIGGFGMAGGMAILGGIVTGPALAIGGALFAKQAEAAYWDAKTNQKKAEEFAEQGKLILTQLNAIKKRANQLKKLMTDINVHFVTYVGKMNSIIDSKGTNWGDYSKEDKEEIYRCTLLAQTEKMLIDTALLGEKGELLSTCDESINQGKMLLEEWV